MSTSRKTVRVMASGHFDPAHFGHVEYLKQAASFGDTLLVVVTSDKQAQMKKGKVNEPQSERVAMLNILLRGLGIRGYVFANIWDKQTVMVAEALRMLKPDIFVRGADKTLADFPTAERLMCEELGIRVEYAHSEKIAHGSKMVL